MKFLDIEINEKMFIKLIIVAIIFIIVYMAFTMSSLLIFKTYKISENTKIDENKEINTHIDELEISGKKIEIAGWAYKEDEEIKTINSSYIIKNKSTGKMYKMRTQREMNHNLEDIGNEIAGIRAQCLLIGLPKGEYEIHVLYKNNDNDILTNTLIIFNII